MAAICRRRGPRRAPPWRSRPCRARAAFAHGVGDLLAAAVAHRDIDRQPGRSRVRAAARSTAARFPAAASPDHRHPHSPGRVRRAQLSTTSAMISSKGATWSGGRLRRLSGTAARTSRSRRRSPGTSRAVRPSCGTNPVAVTDVGDPASLAQRRLPSMITATWRERLAMPSRRASRVHRRHSKVPQRHKSGRLRPAPEERPMVPRLGLPDDRDGETVVTLGAHGLDDRRSSPGIRGHHAR